MLSFRQRLLVTLERRVGLAVQLIGLAQVAGDLLLAGAEDVAYLRQRKLGHEQVKQQEGDRQPEQLRRKPRQVELGQAALRRVRGLSGRDGEESGQYQSRC